MAQALSNYPNLKNKKVMSFRLTKFFLMNCCFILMGLTSKAQLAVAFNATPISGCAPLVVNFHDLSTGNPTQWQWDLGNNTISPLQNPSNTYFNPGLYKVKLVIQNAAGTKDSVTKIDYITVYALPVVNFTATPTSGCFPLPVQFTDNSTPGSGSITSWFWDFGDGITSTAPAPAHTYTAAGNYNVTLKITNSNGCTKTRTKISYISLSNGVHAAFTNNAPSGCSAPQTINFQNQSIGTGLLTYQWTFGDGGTSSVQNPSYSYNSAGSYTVQLIVTNSNGCRDTATHTAGVIIGSVLANFAAPAIICTGNAFTFTNTSTPAPVSSSWTFGDATSSTASSPVKIYNTAGNYTVKLVSDFGGCIDTKIKMITVLPKPAAAFSGTPLTGCSIPKTVNFTNTSTGAIAYEWDFGDNTTSTQQSPQHTYTTENNYTVTLIVTNANGCTDTIVKTDYVKIKLPHVAINNLPQQGCAPLSWTFTSSVTTADPVVSYEWFFGDGTTSSQSSPNHTFSAGIYDIMLVVTTASGCTDTARVPAGIKSSVKPHANFGADPRDVCAFIPINFTDSSTGTITSWHWDFGDGSTSIIQNPTHAYEDTGLFSIQLIVGNNGCYDTLKLTDYVHIKPPIAAFDIGFDCAQRFVRNFTDHSIGADEYTWSYGDGGTSTIPSPSHTYAAAGTYTVTLTVKNLITGCEHTKTAQVTVADEDAIFSANLTQLCKNNATTFTAVTNGGIANFDWDFGDGTTATGLSVQHTYPLVGNYTVKLVVTDVVGCVYTKILPSYITVNGPVVNFAATTPGSCLNTAITFNDQTVTDGVHPVTQWIWHYGDGNGDTLTTSPFTHSYAGAGIYDVQLIVTDSYGCSDSITKNSLLVISTPMADFVSPDTLSCPNKPITFVNNSTGPGLTYNWDFGDGTNSTQAAPIHSYTLPGIYTVHLFITDQYGCTADSVKPQYIKIQYPYALFSMSDSVTTCPELTVHFTNNSINQNTYNWNFGDGTFSSVQNPDHVYNTVGTFYPSLSVTGYGGCTSVKTATIIVRGPQGSFYYTNFIGCKTLDVHFTGTSLDNVSFIWDFNDGTVIETPDSIISHPYNLIGNYLPKMLLKDAGGCIVPILGLDTVRVNGVDAGFITDTLLRCTNGNVVFTNTSQSNEIITGYNWDFDDGTSSNAVSPIHFYASEGIYHPKLKAFSQTGCIDSVKLVLPVKVVKTPDISITQSPNGCIPLNINFAGNLLNADTSSITWHWGFSDGRTANGQTLNTLQFTTANTFTGTLYAANSSGCKDTATTNFDVYPLPVIDAGPDKLICQGTGQIITATGAASYTWSPTAGLSCTNCAAPVAMPDSVKTYTVRGVSSFGCANTDTVKVNVKYPFQMLHSPGDTLCIGESALLSASGALTYQWSPSAGLNNTTAASVTARPDTTTKYMVIGTDNAGCFKDTAYFPVKVYPIPTVNAGQDKTINVGQSATFTPALSTDVTNTIWSPATGIITGNANSITVKPTQTTDYKITVKNAGGCTSSDLVTVFVLCNGANVFIPNTFSPNGDGANEVFYPRGTGLFTIKLAKVFNRWGEVMYEKNDFKANVESAGWDGTFKGQKLTPDVFVYIFEIVCDNNTTLVYKGNIALIK